MKLLNMTFEELFTGTFENKDQAMSGTQWAWIVIKNEKIDTDTFRCTQSYKFDEDQPYKEFITKFTYDGDKVYSRMYDKDMVYRQGCDLVFEKQSDGEWYGHNICKECWVDVDTIKAYQQCDIRIGEGYYNIIDIGINPVGKTIVWGSKFGYLKFVPVD